jgi:hypothetical protein
MARMIVRYKIASDQIDQNEQLIHAVFQELHAKSPAEVRYLALKTADGSFIHLVDDGANFIPHLQAFEAFRGRIMERCIEAPQQSGVTIVGNYRMLDPEAS